MSSQRRSQWAGLGSKRENVVSKTEKVMSFSYKAEQVEELREIFKMYDKENTGKISSRNLKFLLRGLGDNVSEEELAQVLRSMDDDDNGTIDFNEFLIYMFEKVNQQSFGKDILEVFRVFDTTADGYLTPTEIRILMENRISKASVEDFIRRADPEETGEIRYEQFVKRMLS